MTHRLGRKGEVVIPKAFRQAARIEPGDDATVSKEGDPIRGERIVSPDTLTGRLGRLAGHRFVKALEEDGKAERRR